MDYFYIYSKSVSVGMFSGDAQPNKLVEHQMISGHNTKTKRLIVVIFTKTKRLIVTHDEAICFGRILFGWVV